MSCRAMLQLWGRAKRRRRDGVARRAGLAGLRWPCGIGRRWPRCAHGARNGLRRWPRGLLRWLGWPPCGAAWRMCGLAQGCGGARYIFSNREARTGLARERRKKGGMSRPGAPGIPVVHSGGRRNRSGQRIGAASCRKLITIYIPNRHLRRGRNPWPTPGRPAGLCVSAHTHSIVYPSTSSTPPAPHIGRRRVLVARSTRFARSGSITFGRRSLTAVSRPSLTHSGPRQPARACFTSHCYYPVRMALPSSYTAKWLADFWLTM